MKVNENFHCPMYLKNYDVIVGKEKGLTMTTHNSYNFFSLILNSKHSKTKANFKNDSNELCPKHSKLNINPPPHTSDTTPQPYALTTL